MNKNFTFSNYTTATSELGIWKTITTQSGNESAFVLINQGASNDMATSVILESILKETTATPGTSEKGILLMTGDSWNIDSVAPFSIYTRTTTTNATIELLEYALEAQ